MCCCGLGSSLLSLSLSLALLLPLPPSALGLVQVTSLPSSSLFPLSPVPVTTLWAVNHCGDGHGGIKRRRESSSNWLNAGCVVSVPDSLCGSYLQFIYSSTLSTSYFVAFNFPFVFPLVPCLFLKFLSHLSTSLSLLCCPLSPYLTPLLSLAHILLLQYELTTIQLHNRNLPDIRPRSYTFTFSHEFGFCGKYFNCLDATISKIRRFFYLPPSAALPWQNKSVNKMKPGLSAKGK